MSLAHPAQTHSFNLAVDNDLNDGDSPAMRRFRLSSNLSEKLTLSDLLSPMDVEIFSTELAGISDFGSFWQEVNIFSVTN